MEDWVKQIQDRTKKVPVSSGRTKKLDKVNWDDLIFLPAQLAKKPIDYFKDEIKSKTIIGKLSKKPIEIDVPIIIAERINVIRLCLTIRIMSSYPSRILILESSLYRSFSVVFV